VTEELLDGHGQLPEVAAEEVELVGVLQQRQRARGDQVARGLAAGVLQEQEEEIDLQLCEPFAVDLGTQQDAERSSRDRPDVRCTGRP
jgi:hypothetical protein